MLEQLIDLDKSVFLFFNGHRSLYMDHAMWLYTGKLIWLPLILSMVYVFFKKGWKEALFVILMLALVATLCDQVSSSICKPFFARFRPSQDPDFSPFVQVVHNYRGGRYGFISGHATNSFGLVTFTALLFRNRLYTFSAIGWALINCYSRVYLGVHYPGDILFGSLTGILLGFLVYKLYVRLRRPLYEKNILLLDSDPYHETRSSCPVLYTMYVLVFLILAIAPFADFRF